MKNPRITESEILLIREAQRGSQLAFSKLFEKYKGFVESILFSYIKDMDEAKDIANIVFLKVYHKLSKFTDYSSFGGWLRILTNRTAIDYLRSIRLKQRAEVETDRLTASTQISSSEDELVNRLAYEKILEEFEKFPVHMKRILELYYVENLTVVQISEALCVPTGTIKSILSRTRKQIQSSINKI